MKRKLQLLVIAVSCMCFSMAFYTLAFAANHGTDSTGDAQITTAYFDAQGNEISKTVSEGILAPGLGSSSYLTSEADAYKQAVLALKNRNYTKKYPCSYRNLNKYHSIFLLAVMQHPEYNYGIRTFYSYSSNGSAFVGYRIAYSKVTESGVKSKMSATNKKANAILKKIIKKGMTDLFYDYFIKNW